MIGQSYLTEKEENFCIWEIGRDRAKEITDFIYWTYFSRFQKYDILGAADLVKIAIDDILTSRYSRIFAVIAAQDRILGSIRIIEKVAKLPVERDFEFDVLEMARKLFPELMKINRIFEIGRFATSPENIRKAGMKTSMSLKVVDCLLREMFRAVARESGNVGVASLDVNTFRILGMRGIKFQKISEKESSYLGSPTIPVILPVDICRLQMFENKPDLHFFYFDRKEPVLYSGA